MKPSHKNRPSRLALAGLSLGVSALLGSSLVSCASSSDSASTATAQTQDQPNIMMILMDDLGYSDLGPYGGEVETPNLAALTQDSAQFTDFHTTPLCAPTRASLMTGQDRHQVGLGSMEGLTPPGVPETTPGYKGSLEGDFTGIAELLGDNGYDTYQVGKWHLGGDEGQTPQDLGFDQNFTLYDAGASYFSDGHRLFDRPVEPVDTVIHERNGEILDELPDDFFSTRSYTDEMLQMVDQSVEADQPFFGYLAYTAPHDPLHVENEELIEQYLDVYLDKNFEDLRNERIQRMVELGLIDQAQDIRWVDGTPEWDSLTAGQQRDLAYRMAVYAAVIHEADEQIGRVIDRLKETGEYDNTVIAVVSDNGAAASTQLNYLGFGSEGWHEEAYPRMGDMEVYGQQGSFPSIGLPLAQVSSGPYFQAKNTLFEGGTRVPAIIKTPSTDGDHEHRLVDTFAHITDLYPTFADYAGADLGSAGNLLGDSAKPLLDGTSETIGDDEFGWEHFGHRSYRAGDWKLIFTPEPMGGTGEYALYNLAEDPGETLDVIADHPDIARELEEKWERYAEDNGVAVVEFEDVNAGAQTAADNWYAMDWADGTEATDNE
ncbi:arylsulfatase [Corynebacterium sp. YIM 101645]|uniref:Arylsulfatase n=1 Tax=Corynebacterium lemuris TaxID=1859292 RepID=A0ABT2FZM2_9CORY|nr:arylsulfatase [Corynebacterium lemuris]MCS5480703.1 arylsulfatase [Corynebacterium lemuris]